ncbi:COP1-interactive protein 1-like [Diospyros lotus]|uniref:COP1-interactive protein 1-like n=1 Tax=Diospyros lotus TaxID=55363 RepID=UPI00224C9271|nr:COP1-interactive protein 1-like [Diospyros lotus]
MDGLLVFLIAEIDEKVAKIVNLIKNKNQAAAAAAGGKKDSEEVVELIEDLHKQYQALHALYDNLRGEIREKVHAEEQEEAKAEEESSSSSSSDSHSDSESYHSTGEISATDSPRTADLPQTLIDDIKLKLEASGSEFIEHGNNLAGMSKENETLYSEHMAASLSKIQELETLVENLRIETEQTETRNQELLIECTQLREKFVERETAPHKTFSSSSQAKNLLGEENLGLEAHIIELERALKEKEDEREQQLMLENDEAAVHAKGVVDQLNVLRHELESLSSQKKDSSEASSLEKAIQEIANLITEMENFKDKLEGKRLDLPSTVDEEKEGLERLVSELEVEMGSLRSQKSELEEQMRRKDEEANRLRLDKEGLHVRISELEESKMERVDELENGSSSSFLGAAEDDVKNLQKQLRSLQSKKSQLELQIEREKRESLESLSRVEKQNMELRGKIAQLQRSVEGQEDVISKLREEHKQVRVAYMESKSNLQNAEKKIEETAEEFCKKLEDSLRILSRRIKVAEQLHLENKDVYRKTREKYEQEQKELRERAAATGVAAKRMKEASLAANDILTGLDAVALKFEECSGNFLNRISKASCEVLFAKDWVKRKNNTVKHVQEDMDCVLGQVDGKEAEILGLREMVWKSKNQVRELEKMVKEKEEGILGLGEEKREAIRQLCVWIDYHRSRSDYLKKMVLEMTATQRRTIAN